MLGKAGSLEGADTDMGDDRGRGCPLLGGLELPVGGLVGLRIFHEKFFGDTFADFLYGKSLMGLYVN